MWNNERPSVVHYSDHYCCCCVAASLRRRQDRVRAATAFVSMHELRWCWNNVPTQMAGACLLLFLSSGGWVESKINFSFAPKCKHSHGSSFLGTGSWAGTQCLFSFLLSSRHIALHQVPVHQWRSFIWASQPASHQVPNITGSLNFSLHSIISL